MGSSRRIVAVIIRIDLFDVNGVLVSSQAGITIPSRGLYNFAP